MFVKGDMYGSVRDVQDIINGLVEVKTKVSDIDSAIKIDRAIATLYDVIDAAGEYED